MNIARGFLRRLMGGVAAVTLAFLPSIANGRSAPEEQATKSVSGVSRDTCVKFGMDGAKIGESTDTPDFRSGTSMVSISSCWDADTTNDSYRVLNDLYAHWTLTRVDESSNTRDYKGESRPALLRLVLGRNRSFVGSVKIEMHDPDQSFVIPLAAFGYQGKVGKAQSWTTDIVSDDQSQPFFRIGASTSATVSVSAKSADDVEVRASSVILSTLRSITTIVSPGGSLLTTLNRGPLNQASTAIDNALSNIWSQVIEEHQISGRQLSEWYEKSGFLIEVDVPDYVKTRSADGKPMPSIKRIYRLQLSCPRYSIFDPKPACNGTSSLNQPTQDDKRIGGQDVPDGQTSIGYNTKAFLDAVKPLRARVSAEQILNYPLAQGKTIAQFLSDHAWYTQFLRLGDDAGVKSTEDPNSKSATKQTNKYRTDNDYASLCSQIVDSLYSAGLSSFDARLGLWAAISGSSDFVGISNTFGKISQCAALLPAGERGAWKYPDPPS